MLSGQLKTLFEELALVPIRHSASSSCPTTVAGSLTMSRKLPLQGLPRLLTRQCSLIPVLDANCVSRRGNIACKGYAFVGQTATEEGMPR